MALLPTNVKAFGEGLEQSSEDVTLSGLAGMRSATTLLPRLAGCDHRCWLWLSSTRVASRLTPRPWSRPSQLDASNLEELTSSLEGGMFEPQKTPEQLATLQRLETMLALVEGWVDEVVTQATAQWMPSAVALAEAVRRARASGGPAEETFATLVGLELRPRRMRDAANLG